jgi:tRNA pseudouridine55 synthase
VVRNRRGRSVNGILVLDKPSGMTSNGALQRVKRLFNAAKAGHTGSLDPLATGVLPLCFGEATKFSQYVLDADKGYLSTFVLGVGTDTLDAEGEETARANASAVTEILVERALTTLLGDIQQVPPMYSAIKRDGQPLYKLARQGVEIERKSRQVTIHAFSMVAFRPGAEAEVDVLIRCTKGTYVRSLAESLGAALGLPAHVGSLRRDKAGPYTLASAVTLATLESLGEQGESAVDALLQPMDGPLQDLPAIEVGESASYYLKQGQPVLVPNGPRSGIVRAYATSGLFLGIGEMLDDGRVAPRRLVVR